jgi:hypothetical protein
LLKDTGLAGKLLVAQHGLPPLRNRSCPMLQYLA